MATAIGESPNVARAAPDTPQQPLRGIHLQNADLPSTTQKPIHDLNPMTMGKSQMEIPRGSKQSADQQSLMSVNVSQFSN